MRHLIRRILHHFYRPLVQRYLQRDRRYCYRKLDLIVRPGVFHPGLFGSTRALLHAMDDLSLKGMAVLDLGCGSGLLGLYASQAGATTTAVDIHPAAVENTRLNAIRNELELEVYQSDLFAALPEKAYDLILLNPPFFKGHPERKTDFAWYAGAEYQYFHRLFIDLKRYSHPESRIWMILSEVCDLENIKTIAHRYGWMVKEEKRIARWWEVFILFCFFRKT